jgi:hypothetical protein
MARYASSGSSIQLIFPDQFDPDQRQWSEADHPEQSDSNDREGVELL